MSSSTSTPLSSAPLQLFPSPSASRPPPSKSSMKKPRSNTPSPAHEDLVGIALQISTKPQIATRVQPADRKIKHITITPRSSTIQVDAKPSNLGSPRRQLRTRRSSALSTETMPHVSEPLLEDDQLSPLPINTSFTPSTPPRIRTPTGRLQRTAVPKEITTTVESNEEHVHAEGDQLSPLPSKEFFRPPTPPNLTEYPSPSSFRSAGSTLVRSNSGATQQTPSSATPAPQMRSMFPQYDHSKPLSRQQYHPCPSSALSPVTRPHFSKRVSRPTLKREDSGVALMDEYQSVPKATTADMLGIWHASTAPSRPSGRKVQLELNQPTGQGMSLAIGTAGSSLYHMEATEHKASPKGGQLKQLAIKKTCPETQIASPVAQLSLNDASKVTGTDTLTAISPHQAAVDAIHIVANTPAACEIAYFDPVGKSPEAARLAQDAVGEAHRRHTCELSRTTRRRDSFGAVTASYQLQHPSLVSLAITVSKATSSAAPNDPKAKITLHHPSATEAAVAAENLALLSLDFATNACILDTPGLLALDEPYLLDTVISAVFAVAVIENDQVVRDVMSFAPPPKTPFAPTATKKRPSRSFSSVAIGMEDKNTKKGRWYRPSSRKSKKAVAKHADDDLPALAHGALTVVSLGVRSAIWLLDAGLKVGAGAVKMAVR